MRTDVSQTCELKSLPTFPGMTLTKHKRHFGAIVRDFLGTTINPEGVEPQKARNTTFFGIENFPKSKKASPKRQFNEILR